jgi:membrane protein required for beta-lactamase induction
VIRKSALVAAILVLMIAATVLTVLDHLLIGVIVFVAMIVMVAVSPGPGESNEESDMARARRRRSERTARQEQ